MLDQILNFATDMDSEPHEDYVNAKDWNPRTVLHEAVSSNFLCNVQFLLLRRAKLGTKDVEDLNPLVDAAALGHSSL